MRPELFHLDLPFGLDVGVPAYFLLLLTGFIFATTCGALWARRIGKNPDVIVDLGLACLLAGVAGGRILHVIADGYFMDYVHLCTDPSKVDWHVEQAACVPKYHGVWDAAAGVCHPATRDCFRWAMFWSGGLTYYGGFIGATAMAMYLLKKDRFPFWKAADMAGFAIPIGLGFGRMGCLLAGCCFGVESSSGFAMSFPPHSPATESQFKLHELATMSHWSKPVLPTQIFESALSLGIAAFCLLYVHPRKRYDGQVFVAFLASYAIGRFLLEYLRADDRGGFFNLSTSQLIGIAMVVAAALLHQRLSRASSPAAVPSAAT